MLEQQDAELGDPGLSKDYFWLAADGTQADLQQGHLMQSLSSTEMLPASWKTPQETR